MSHHLTYLEAVVTGLVQGVTELFPVSSLGHNVLLPAVIGKITGNDWASVLSVSAKNSPYLAFVVGLHVATAIAMIAFFWRDWVRIVRGFFSSIAQRRVATADQRLAWMIIAGTIPVGIVGLVLQKEITKVFATPKLAAAFLAINGVILLVSERMRRNRAAASGGSPAVAAAGGPPAGYPQGYRQQPEQQQWQGPGDPRYGQGAPGPYEQGQPGRDPRPGRPPQPGPGDAEYGRGPAPGAQEPWGARDQQPAARPRPGEHRAGSPVSDGRRAPGGAEGDPAVAADERLSTMGLRRAVIVGAAQILALFPGISRDGIVTVVGMGRGLTRQDAVRYSFLLSAPVILAAGALKAHDLTGPLGKGIHGPVLVGSLLAGIGAYLSIRFLTKYFSEDKSLSPFGVYCLVAGVASLAYLVL